MGSTRAFFCVSLVVCVCLGGDVYAKQRNDKKTIKVGRPVLRIVGGAVKGAATGAVKGVVDSTKLRGGRLDRKLQDSAFPISGGVEIADPAAYVHPEYSNGESLEDVKYSLIEEIEDADGDEYSKFEEEVVCLCDDRIEEEDGEKEGGACMCVHSGKRDSKDEKTNSILLPYIKDLKDINIIDILDSFATLLSERFDGLDAWIEEKYKNFPGLNLRKDVLLKNHVEGIKEEESNGPKESVKTDKDSLDLEDTDDKKNHIIEVHEGDADGSGVGGGNDDTPGEQKGDNDVMVEAIIYDGLNGEMYGISLIDTSKGNFSDIDGEKSEKEEEKRDKDSGEDDVHPDIDGGDVLKISTIAAKRALERVENEVYTEELLDKVGGEKASIGFGTSSRLIGRKSPYIDVISSAHNRMEQISSDWNKDFDESVVISLGVSVADLHADLKEIQDKTNALQYQNSNRSDNSKSYSSNSNARRIGFRENIAGPFDGINNKDYYGVVEPFKLYMLDLKEHAIIEEKNARRFSNLKKRLNDLIDDVASLLDLDVFTDEYTQKGLFRRE